MGNGRSDCKAFCDITTSLLYRGPHCHDFCDFFIHFHGRQQMGLGNDFFILEPCQLFIFPPFSMHGLVCMTEALDYEQAYLYCSAIAAKDNMLMPTKQDAASHEAEFDHYALMLSFFSCALRAVRRQTAAMPRLVNPSPLQAGYHLHQPALHRAPLPEGFRRPLQPQPVRPQP